MNSLRVLIVDDHEASRGALRSLLSWRPEWPICGEAVDGMDAVEKARALRPDVILMDISMPRMNGLDAIRIIQREWPESQIVIVSQNDPAMVRQQADAVGAAGYVAKMDLSRNLIPILDDISKRRTSQNSEMNPVDKNTPEPDWLTGSGEMTSLLRAKNWSATPLGPTEKWSPTLRMMTSFLLANRFPLLLWWGPEYVSIYNDAYRPILGTKHPQALGLPVSECWSEIWHILRPLIDTPFHGGPATWMEDLELELCRSGFTEETHFTVAYSPVPDPTAPGGIGGVLATVHEITDKIVSERRVSILADLSARATEAKTAEQACAVAAEVLSAHSKDVPFALIYLIDREAQKAKLAGSAGVAAGSAIHPFLVDLAEASSGSSGWPLAEEIRAERVMVVENLNARFDSVPKGPWSEPPHSAVVVPIRSNKEHDLAGVLIAGISPRLALDTLYRSFLELVAAQIAAAVSNARAYEDERKRSEALSEIDRAKTIFFSNISHEFRTPLSLMLGPVEDLLSGNRTDLSASVKTQLELVNRNGSRLLRLVHTLLDFSRIEAGRMQAVYQPTDLSEFTMELASVFRSATEKAGLRLELDCPKLDQPVFVDRDMWEKIVLNLISNAFKFTFEGEIAIWLAQSGNSVELRVRDTGVGIPANELPRLFDRFHRVQNARSRTHEGSGIGLAFVQELVKLHGGAVRVESVPGKGSTFFVRLPLGSAHLPSDRIAGRRSPASTAVGATPFLEEALGWLASAEQPSPQDILPLGLESIQVPGPLVSENDGSFPDRPRVLIADDNADMRNYLVRLLTERYDVTAVPNGLAALEAVRVRTPDLILSDVMMPELNGFGLLNELRSDPKTKAIPIILLSARAGEESRVEGMEHGADDYLIKPFSARELLARVQTHLQMARVRKEAEEALRDKERRLRLSTEAAQLGIWQWYLEEDKVTWENDRSYEIFGRTPEDGAIHLAEFKKNNLHPNDMPVFEQAVSTLLKTGARLFCQCRINRKDGSIAWIELTGQLEHKADGTPWRVLGSALDITERVHKEEALRESEQRLRLSQQAAHSGTWDWNTETMQIVSSPELNKLFGIDPKTAGTDRDFWRQLVHPEDLKVLDRALEEAIEAHKEFHVEFRITRPDGTPCWLETVAQVFYNDSGKAVRVVGVTIDITERKKVEERERNIAAEAMAATAKFRAVFEQSSVFAAIMTPDGVIIDANRLSLEACGYRPEEVLGRPFWNTGWWRASGEVQAKIRAGITQAARGIPYLETLPYHWADGTPRLVDFGLYPILDPQGQVIFLHPTGRDVTERKEAERTTGLLAAIVDSSDDAIISKNLEGFITSWNSGAERVFGYTQEEAVGRHITLIIPQDRHKEEASILERLKRGERVEHFETRRVRKDGTTRDISLSISPVKDASGRVVGASKVARDVTDRKQIEQALRESEERFRAMVETTTECVKLVAADGTLLQMNSSGLTMVGADCADSVVGKSVYDLIAPKDREKFRLFNERICRGEKAALEFEMVNLRGAARHMETHAAPLQFSDGTVVQLGVTRDITERTRAEKELRRSEEKLRTLAGELESQVRSRTRELELRNSEILQQSEQLRDLSKRLLQAQDQERRHIARELHDSAGQIVTVLGINLARIGQRARQNIPQVAEEVEDCRQLANQLSQEIRTTSYLLYPPLLDETGLHQALGWYIQGLMQRSGLEIKLNLSKDFGRLPRELELVVYRLVQECLTNIHRHSGSKSASIRLFRAGNIISLEIQDAGRGIPAEKLKLLQLQGAGVGIRGMFERVRQFNGEMDIQSDGSGTTVSFIFHVPAMASPGPESIDLQVQAPS